MSKHEEMFKGISIGCNYGTMEQSAKHEDSILIDKDDKYNDKVCMSATVEEARWMAKKLLEFADEIEEAKNAVPDNFYFETSGSRSGITFKCTKENDNLYMVYWNYDTKNVPYYSSEVKEKLAKGKWKIIETEVM